MADDERGGDDGDPDDRKASPPRSPAGTVLMEPSKEGSASPQRGSGGTLLIDPKAPAKPKGAKGKRSRTAAGTVMIDPAERASDAGRPSRTSSLGGGGRRSRTTLYEVGEMAQRLSLLPQKKAEDNILRQLTLSFAISVTLVLLVSMIFMGGAWRTVLAVLAGTAATTIAVWMTLRSLPRIAAKIGPRELPGPALLWVGGVVAVAAGITVAATWSVAEVTKPLAVIAVPKPPEPAPTTTASAAVAPAPPARADAAMKRGLHVSLGDGVLYAPPDFQSEDGTFDLLVHYHGNVELVEQSIAHAKLNALVHIINFGESSGRYSEPLRNPRAFDDMLGAIEKRAREKLGLETPRIRRVALSSWSAGFGAVYHILSSRSRLDRVDALLMMDSLHASYQPGSKTLLTPLSLAPFLQFAERAIADEKLMVLTHSAVKTEDYPSTSQSADGLLERLEVERKEVSPDEASPPPSELEEAKKAFPSKDREWMRVTSEARRGSMLVLGCSGEGKGDHIAHLAQMSVTVLPKLRERWKESRPR